MSKKHVGPVSTATILGLSDKKIAPKIHDTCVVCLKKLPAIRIKALQDMSIPFHKWAHTSCSQITKIKGVYLGENGTSELQLCDKVYNDSVRSVFHGAEATSSEDEESSDN